MYAHVRVLDDSSRPFRYSSDFAMPAVLGARGYSYSPWREIRQQSFDDPKYTDQPREAAFQHFSRGYEGGKPTYQLKLTDFQNTLFTDKKWPVTTPSPPQSLSFFFFSVLCWTTRGYWQSACVGQLKDTGRVLLYCPSSKERDRAKPSVPS